MSRDFLTRIDADKRGLDQEQILINPALSELIRVQTFLQAKIC